jgi:hypothetical protein
MKAGSAALHTLQAANHNAHAVDERTPHLTPPAVVGGLPNVAASHGRAGVVHRLNRSSCTLTAHDVVRTFGRTIRELRALCYGGQLK